MQEISVTDLKAKIDAGEDIQIVDVREQYEYDIANLNGDLIPLGEVMNRADEIARDKTVVVHCRSGARSASAISVLESQHGFTNLYNLKGGILAYAEEIDPSLTKY